jgi:hypothetical protein
MSKEFTSLLLRNSQFDFLSAFAKNRFSQLRDHHQGLLNNFPLYRWEYISPQS